MVCGGHHDGQKRQWSWKAEMACVMTEIVGGEGLDKAVVCKTRDDSRKWLVRVACQQKMKQRIVQRGEE